MYRKDGMNDQKGKCRSVEVIDCILLASSCLIDLRDCVLVLLGMQILIAPACRLHLTSLQILKMTLKQKSFYCRKGALTSHARLNKVSL